MSWLVIWRILIICGLGVVLSWVPVIYQIRRDSHDDPGPDLAWCLGLLCGGVMLGLSSAAIRHITSPTTVPVMSLFSGAIFFGVRARVRWYMNPRREDAHGDDS